MYFITNKHVTCLTKGIVMTQMFVSLTWRPSVIVGDQWIQNILNKI